MPTYEITAPDGRKFRVTGPGTREEALAQVQAQYQPQQPRQPQQRPDNRPDGDALTALIEPANTLVSGGVASALGGLAGIAGTLLPGEQGQGARWVENVQQALTYRPRTKAGSAVTEAIGYPFERLAQGADIAGQSAADVTGSPAVGAAVNTALQAAPALLARGRVRRNVDRGANPARPGAEGGEVAPGAQPAASAQRSTGLARVPEAAPTIEELSAQAKAAYKRASDAGINISEPSLTGLKTKIVRELNKEGVDPTLHPATTAALRRITDTKGEITLDQLETLRKIASDAKGATAPADRRLAARIVDELDDYVANLSEKDVTSGRVADASALKEARDLYSRKMKAEQINELIERAGIRANGQFSGSGFENALRTEFRQLALNKNRMRRFTAEEQAAIKKVANGGKMENAFRFLGKFAPTGVVSGTLAGGLATAAFGPVGAGVPLAGLAGREIATRMTARNARRAEEIMRRGSQRQQQQTKQKAPLEY